MGIITLEKANHLFWLGRYTERVFSSIVYFQISYDIMIDQDANIYKEYCRLLDIEDHYQDSEDFCKRYIFDQKNFDSIHSSLNRAYDNAIVLRDEISSTCLSYIEMARQVLQMNEDSEAPILELQTVMDMIYSFWGSADDYVEEEVCRNIIKLGRYLERLDMITRLDPTDADKIQVTVNKLNTRITHLQGTLNGLQVVDPKYPYLSQLDLLTKVFEVE